MAAELPTGAVPTKAFLQLDELGKLAGIISAGLLVLSIAYDYFFLLALGLSFDSVPTTIADHVRSAIVWAPRVALFLFAFAIYELAMRRVEGGLTEEELIRTSPTPRFTKWFRSSANVMFVVVAVPAVIVTTLTTASFRALFLGSMLVWGLLSLSVIQHPRMGAWFSARGARTFVIVPLAIIYVASFGYGRAEEMLTAKDASWDLSLKSEGGVEKRKLTGMRSFSTVAITVEVDHRVSILPADRILSVSNIPGTGSPVPNLCKWFNVMCPSNAPSPKKQPSNP